MRTVDDITAAMTAIIDGAVDRPLSDDEVTAYEGLETELQAAGRDTNLRARHKAYNVVRYPAGVPVNRTPDSGAESELDAAFTNYLRTGRANADMSGLRVTNEQGEGSGPAGGYTVPTGFRQKLVEVRKSFGGFSAVAETITTDTGAPLEYPTIDDTANEGDITPENEVVADGQDMVFGVVNLGAYKYTSAGTGSGLPLRVPVELLQDSAFDIQGFIARAMATRIQRKQARHWVVGTGVSQPQGIVAPNLTADRDLDTPDTPDYEDLVDLQDLLDEEYDPNARWGMRKSTWSQLRLIVDLNGRPIIQDSTTGISGRPERLLLGKPVVIDEAFPVLSSAADTFPIVYGDFREAYVIRRVSNLVIVVNPYNRAAYGQVEFTAWERADGAVQNRSAYKILQNNT